MKALITRWRCILVAVLLAFGTANAAPLTWTLNGVTTSDGETWTGTFDYDDVDNTYTNINIISSVPGFPNPVDTVSVDILGAGCVDPATASGVTLGFNAAGVTIFCMDFASPLSNLGGTVNLVTGGIGWGTIGIGETITAGSVSAPTAGPIRWTLNNVTTSDGATWTGYFHYDASTNTYDAINIDSSVPGWPGTVDTVSPAGGACVDPPTASGVTLSFNATGITIFCMDFASPLTNGGGTINLVTGGIGWGTIGVAETITGGSVTGAPFPPPISVSIDAAPLRPNGNPTPNGKLHPRHTGEGSWPNDLVDVTVYGQSIADGDPEDFDTGTIDPATLSFGPDEAPINPASTPEFGLFIDADTVPDARFEFQVGDTGIACTDTDATLDGNTTVATGAVAFEGTAAIDTNNCVNACHN